MEKLSLEHGIAGLCVILTLNVLLRVGEFLWSLREKKDTLSEDLIRKLTQAVHENTSAMEHLDRRMEMVEKGLSELPKFKNDIRRFYSAIKEVAGEDWPRVRDEIMKDEFHL